jgi:hypothetical protein
MTQGQTAPFARRGTVPEGRKGDDRPHAVSADGIGRLSGIPLPALRTTFTLRGKETVPA